MKNIQQTERSAHVRCAIWMTKNTSLAPSAYERKLLLQFVNGTLTIDQVLSLAEATQQHSRAQP